jgi:hypothetical protein
LPVKTQSGLRLDLDGIGDSVQRIVAPPNHQIACGESRFSIPFRYDFGPYSEQQVVRVEYAATGATASRRPC